eukprot:COSAG01_NODE_7636_length_3119_cov_1.363907_1_plen_640_part_00
MRDDKTFIFALAISTDDQRIGYGSFMLHYVAQQHTCDKIYVQSDKTAVPFYQKIGFVPATDEKNAKYCKAMVIDRSTLLNLDVARPENMHIKCHTFQDADIQSQSAREDPMDIDTEASTDSDDPAVYDVTVLPTGPLSDESKNRVGNGGCSAFGLYQLGLFRSTEDAKCKLNYFGEKQLQKLRDENGGSYERKRVYVKNDSWSSEVIKRTVVAEGFDFEKLQLNSDDVCLKRELKRGKYLLDGVQNQDHTRHQGSVYTNVPGYSPGPAEAPMHWRHAIPIIDGKVYEQNADVFSIQYLWLKDDNRPNINKGYMREVLKVYKITKKSDKRTAEPASRSIRKRPRVSIAAVMSPAFKGSDGNDYEARAPVTQDILGTPDVSLVDGEVRIFYAKDATNVLGINALTALDNLLETIPEAPLRNVVKHKAQWTMGNHPSLNGRTNKPMPRNKIFAQKGDPRSIGTRQYQYTGKQNRVDYMTCDVSKIPLLASMIKEYDAVLPEGVPASNHYITTMYSDGTYCIDAHSDKDVTLDKESVITVVKLGPGSRKFIIRENTGTTTLGKILFDQVLPPGTIVQMTLKGNAMTTHEVPREPDNTEMSGSIVFRTSNLLYTPEQVQKRVAQSDKNINTVIHFVDPAADDSA